MLHLILCCVCSQDKKYQDTAENTATQQVDNKFEFYKKEGGGYANKENLYFYITRYGFNH